MRNGDSLGDALGDIKGGLATPRQSIGRTYLTYKGQKYLVSTVDLPFDHGDSNNPEWFETMIFKKGSCSDLFCRRYATRDQSTQGHLEVVQEKLQEGYSEITETDYEAETNEP